MYRSVSHCSCLFAYVLISRVGSCEFIPFHVSEMAFAAASLFVKLGFIGARIHDSEMVDLSKWLALLYRIRPPCMSYNFKKNFTLVRRISMASFVSYIVLLDAVEQVENLYRILSISSMVVVSSLFIVILRSSWTLVLMASLVLFALGKR